MFLLNLVFVFLKKKKCQIKENFLLILKSGFVFILFLFKDLRS